MRITPDTLHKLAQDTVNRRARASREIIAAYLCGSLLEEDPMIGGTLDLDLVFIHYTPPASDREIIPLTENAHLDIAHHPESDYRQARSLRDHPWLGPTIKNCKPLYDPQHLLDFTQASVGGHFERPYHVMQRARRSYDQSRAIWLTLQSASDDPGHLEAYSYLRAVWHATNAIASLSGPPLTDRRLLLNFPLRAAAIDRPGLYAGLIGLLGAPNLSLDLLNSWLVEWQNAYLAAPAEHTPARLHPQRYNYYHKAMQAILAGPQPLAILWPLLRTWTLLVNILPPASAPYQAWQNALTQAGLLGAGFPERLVALDAFLDLIDETLEKWGLENGA